MEEFQKAEKLVKHIEEYIRTQLSMIKLDVAEKLSRIVSWIIAGVLVFFILLLGLIFFSLSIAHEIAHLTGQPYLGYLVVGGIYLLIAFVVWWKKKKLLQLPLLNLMIRQLFSEENHDDGKNQKHTGPEN